jgi:hypothetical protein
MGETFNTFGTTLNTIATLLQAAIQILRAASFISMGSTVAAERFLSYWQPKIKQAGKLCQELAQDAIQSAADWERAGRTG